ncbi:PAS domain S-box protein [Fictibacillus aquaticus]|uniref:histidine kinase n=1 Tax=Fictibacillus aquaticus TaxID=2021314 RepID=A0A235FFE2_9BACL|nr:PAS domain S-box protein [Fictibacillus aquaticus]OYD59713.1 hypothetical protein CGZ90_07485 [Fictibacillus aquaticus]
MHLTHINVYLVMLSLCISVLTSYLALFFVGKSTESKTQKVSKICIGGIGFGLGIWAMHFIAMTAMHVSFQYDWFMTLLSLLIAILASSLSFYKLFNTPNKMPAILLSCSLLSAGIISMHYLGIYAIKFKGIMIFNWFYVVLSIVIAFIICFAALNIFYLFKKGSSILLINKWTSAVLMGLSIASMHFISMMGIAFHPDPSAAYEINPVEHSLFLLIVVLVTSFIIISSLLLAGYENKVMREAAKWGEERYQSLFLHNPDAIFTFDLEGRFMTINPAGEALTGYKAEEIIGQSFAPLIAEEDLEKTYSHFQKCLSGESQEYKVWAISKDNRRVYVNVKNTPIIMGDQIIGAYSICSDITELYTTQQALKEKQSLYQSILTTMSDGLVVIDTEGKMLLANEKAAAMVNYDYEDFQKTTPLSPSWQLIREDGSCYLPEEKPIYQTLKTGKAFYRQNIGVKLSDENGSENILWISANTAPLVMDGVLKGVVVTYRDISKEKKQEDTLKVSNEIMSTLIENLQFGVLEEDENRNILLANEECFKIFGSSASPKDFYGMNIKDLSGHIMRFFPEKINVKKQTETIIHNKKMVTDEILLNNSRLIRRTYIPIFSNELYKGHFWKIEDITEERKLEESLYIAKEEAEKANRAKSEFLSKMSHELRTPLNAILGFAQILEYDSEEPLTFQQNQKVQEILQGGRHLLHLINEVLDLSSIESGHTAFQFEHAVFEELLEQSLALVQKQADEMNVTLEIIELPEIPIILNVDTTRFQQILINLLTNAIKYNRKNGNVSLAACKKDQYVTLAVKDTGQGIPAHDLPHIFEPFYRGSDVKGRIEGTGVGLSIAKMMTEKMGGEMSVASEAGRGSTFTITFPFTEDFVFPRTKEMKKGTYRFSSRKVLYIEDSASNTALMYQVLKNIPGIELFTSKTAGEGILLAKSLLPDIIMLDLHMPDMNGLEVFRILKKTGSTRFIPVIAVSAAAMESDVEQALSSGFADYVTKPIDINQVMEVLYKHLEASFVSQ